MKCCSNIKHKRFAGMNSLAFKAHNYQIIVNINKRTELRKPLTTKLFMIGC